MSFHIRDAMQGVPPSRPFIAREYAARTASFGLLKRSVSQLAPELLLLGEFLPPQAVDETWGWNATVELFNELRGQFDGVLQRALERGGLWQMLVEPRSSGLEGHAARRVDRRYLEAGLGSLLRTRTVDCDRTDARRSLHDPSGCRHTRHARSSASTWNLGRRLAPTDLRHRLEDLCPDG